MPYATYSGAMTGSHLVQAGEHLGCRHCLITLNHSILRVQKVILMYACPQEA